MRIGKSTTHEWISYWLLVWQKRSKAKLFSPHRAIAPILSGAVQFLWFRAHRPMKELGVITALICVIYLALYAIESVWNFLVISPARIHFDLAEENTKLKAILNSPEWSQEQRKREQVRQMLQQFSHTGRRVMQFILDNGDTPVIALHNARFGHETHQTIRRATNLNLVLERVINNKTILTINPEFRAALASVLDEEASSLTNSTTEIA